MGIISPTCSSRACRSFITSRSKLGLSWSRPGPWPLRQGAHREEVLLSARRSMVAQARRSMRGTCRQTEGVKGRALLAIRGIPPSPRCRGKALRNDLAGQRAGTRNSVALHVPLPQSGKCSQQFFVRKVITNRLLILAGIVMAVLFVMLSVNKYQECRAAGYTDCPRVGPLISRTGGGLGNGPFTLP